MFPRNPSVLRHNSAHQAVRANYGFAPDRTPSHHQDVARGSLVLSPAPDHRYRYPSPSPSPLPGPDRVGHFFAASAPGSIFRFDWPAGSVNTSASFYVSKGRATCKSSRSVPFWRSRQSWLAAKASRKPNAPLPARLVRALSPVRPTIMSALLPHLVHLAVSPVVASLAHPPAADRAGMAGRLLLTAENDLSNAAGPATGGVSIYAAGSKHRRGGPCSTRS